ncbi:MAG: hypothetical protein JWO35_578 [Candidatus Saccharibacteria bacterium]|nr:hypothetical protein [Candidatus Saccharibacteria bacterium]
MSEFDECISVPEQHTELSERMRKAEAAVSQRIGDKALAALQAFDLTMPCDSGGEILLS